MKAKNVVFWLIFIIAGVWAQRLVPGVDLLVPALLLSLQERSPAQAFWLAAVFILVQEGTGSFGFGAALLLYAALVLFYFIGRWLFEAGNILFASLLGLALGAAHYGLITGMQTLQEAAAPRPDLLFESLLQAFTFPVIWGLLRILRKDRVPRADTV